MFNELEYPSEFWKNLDVHEYKDKIGKMKKELATDNFGCLLFFLMCHGNKNVINFEKCKCGCEQKSMKRKDFELDFEKTEETKNIATVLFMNNCRDPEKENGN